MTKAGERIIEALKEAKAVAKGEQPAAALRHLGRAYVPRDTERQRAAALVLKYVTNPTEAQLVASAIVEGVEP